MDSLFLFIGLMTIVTVVFGCIKVLKVNLIFEFKKYNNPYYNIGLSFSEYNHEEEGYIDQEFMIGMFFMNVIIQFSKEEIDFE